MHPRRARTRWSPARRAKAEAVLAFVRERGSVHPREVDAHFNHGKVTNWFGGSSNASTELLDGMHYRGLLRVARRDAGTRVYAAREPWPDAGERAQVRARMDTLVDVLVATYAPLPARTLSTAGTPAALRARRNGLPSCTRALAHAKQRLAHARVDGVDWYWPAGEDPAAAASPPDDRVWLLAPFDPVVWDRRRFELFWGWAYRFEAYTPAPKRKLGHYALPLLWRERVVGWANVSVDGRRDAARGAASSARASASRRSCAAVDDELHRLHRFLGLQPFDASAPCSASMRARQRAGHFGKAGAAFAARQVAPATRSVRIAKRSRLATPTLERKVRRTSPGR